MVAKGRKDCKDPSGAMVGGNLGHAASDRQQETTYIIGKDWPDGSKDPEQRTVCLGAITVGFWASRLKSQGVTVGIQREVHPRGENHRALLEARRWRCLADGA